MARGFGVTSGVSDTDSIEIAFNEHNAQRSYGVRYRRLGNAPDNATGFMGLFHKRVLGDPVENLRWSDQNRIMYSRQFSGATGRWYVNDADVIGTGHNSIVITYDSSSAANDPSMYANGRVLTVTEDLTPSGTVVNNTDNYVIGNRKNDNGECWQGEISDFAIWNAILTPDEALAYAKGFSPLLIRPNLLVVYLPLIRDVIDYKRAATPIVVGTTVAPHPRVLFPQKPATITKPSVPRIVGGNVQAGDALVNASGSVFVDVTGTAAVGDASVSASGSVIVGVTGTTMAGAASVNASGSVFVDATGTAAAGDASVVATARVLVRANGAVSAGPADVNAVGIATSLPPPVSLKQWWLGLKLRRGIEQE